MAIVFAQPDSGPNAESAAAAYGALQTNLQSQPTQKDVFAANQQAFGARFAAQNAAQRDIFDTQQGAYKNLFTTDVGAQKDIYGVQSGAQKDIYNTDQNASLQYGLADQRASAAMAQQQAAASNQAARDAQLNDYQQQQDEQTQKNKMDMAQQQSQLQAELSQTQLTQGETMRLQRQQNTLDEIENNPIYGPPGEDTEDRRDLRQQIMTGISPLQQRQQRASAIASELRLQQMQQDQALADAQGIEGEAARAQAWQRRNTFTDPTTGTRYGLDRNGNIAGTFDAESGEYVPFGLQSTRERQAQQQQQRDEQQQQQEQVRTERQEQQRQTQLSGALQTQETSLRNEFQHFQQAQLRTDNRAPTPRWIQDELDTWNEMIPKEDGKPWTANDMTAEDLDRLVGQTAEARVRRTHPGLFPTTVNPDSWQSQGNSNAFPGTMGTQRANTTQGAVADVIGSVMQSQGPPEADRVLSLAGAVEEAMQNTPSHERSPFGGAGPNDQRLSEMHNILRTAAARYRSLTPSENARYRRLAAELVRHDPRYSNLLP